MISIELVILLIVILFVGFGVLLRSLMLGAFTGTFILVWLGIKTGNNFMFAMSLLLLTVMSGIIGRKITKIAIGESERI